MNHYLRPMQISEWPSVAELIFTSTNAWYQRQGKPAIFTCSPRDVALFCQVYEDLDPGCCVLAEDEGRLAGSCFYHPRSTHVSLGIMNVHPEFFGKHVARELLRFITTEADRRGLPTRLVSSAMNLDSYSLYTRAGFVPRLLFQDMLLPVPASGLGAHSAATARIRPAEPRDAAAMAALEQGLAGIERERDYRYFLENRRGIWHASVHEDSHGQIDGFLVSVHHPASNMLGPGVAQSEQIAAELIFAELDQHRGRSPLFLVPAEARQLVQTLYAAGARNCELHVLQCRGAFTAPQGIILPTFMPETG